METIKDNDNQEAASPEPVKKSGRGGRRAGAGRPFLELHQEADRAVTKSITLTVREWEYLRSHSKSKSYSKAVSAAVALALFPDAVYPADWLPRGDKYAGPGPRPAGELKAPGRSVKK